MKRAFKMKKKAFFIIFKGLLMKQITQFFLKSQGPTLKDLDDSITKMKQSKKD